MPIIRSPYQYQGHHVNIKVTMSISMSQYQYHGHNVNFKVPIVNIKVTMSISRSQCQFQNHKVNIKVTMSIPRSQCKYQDYNVNIKVTVPISRSQSQEINTMISNGLKTQPKNVKVTVEKIQIKGQGLLGKLVKVNRLKNLKICERFTS